MRIPIPHSIIDIYLERGLRFWVITGSCHESSSSFIQLAFYGLAVSIIFRCICIIHGINYHVLVP